MSFSSYFQDNFTGPAGQTLFAHSPTPSNNNWANYSSNLLSGSGLRNNQNTYCWVTDFEFPTNAGINCTFYMPDPTQVYYLSIGAFATTPDQVDGTYATNATNSPRDAYMFTYQPAGIGLKIEHALTYTNRSQIYLQAGQLAIGAHSFKVNPDGIYLDAVKIANGATLQAGTTLMVSAYTGGSITDLRFYEAGQYSGGTGIGDGTLGPAALSKPPVGWTLPTAADLGPGNRAGIGGISGSQPGFGGPTASDPAPVHKFSLTNHRWKY